MAEMRNLTAYFSQLREDNTWENMAPVYAALFHKDVKIAGAYHHYDYDGWAKQCQDFLKRGVSFDMEKIVKDGDNIIYTVTIHEGNVSLRHTAKGVFKDGQMIRTEPADPTIYDRIASNMRKPVSIL